MPQLMYLRSSLTLPLVSRARSLTLIAVCLLSWVRLSHASPEAPTVTAEPHSLTQRVVGAWLTHAVQPSLSPLLTLQVGGQVLRLGPQEGWLTAPLSARPVLEALLALVGAPPPEVAHSLSLAPMGTQLGVPLFDHRASPTTSGAFPHLSIEGARWLADQVEREEPVAFGVPVRRLLVTLYGRQLTQLAVARLWLIDQARLEFERAAYVLAMKDMYFQGPAYLKLRFGDIETGYATPSAPDYVAFGFWLRREIDGSGPVLWRALQGLLPLIDPELPARLSALRSQEPPRPTFDGPISLDELRVLYERLLKQLSEQGLKAVALSSLKAGLESAALPYPLIRPRLEEEQGERPFTYYHARFIQWAAEQLIPPADLSIAGESASAHYLRHLKPTIDNLIATYLILRHSPERLKQERFELMMSLMSKVSPLVGLRGRFKRELAQLQPSPLFTPEECLAFWLKRELDGSAPMLWGALRLLVKRFDPARAQELELVPRSASRSTPR